MHWFQPVISISTIPLCVHVCFVLLCCWLRLPTSNKRTCYVMLCYAIVLVSEQDTSDQHHGEWFLRCHTMLKLSLWISGVLNDVLVSGLRYSVGPGLRVHAQWSRSLQLRARLVCRSHTFVGAFCFPNLLSKVPSPSLLQLMFENAVSTPGNRIFLNWYKFLWSLPCHHW